jgi:hypothetical protein
MKWTGIRRSSCAVGWSFPIAMALLLAVAGSSVAQRPEGRPNPPGKGPWGGPAWNPSASDFDETLAAAQGILFVDGHYVPPPMVMRIDEGRLLVNDLEIASTIAREADRPRPWHPTPNQAAYELGGFVTGCLSSQQVVIALANQPLVVLVAPREQCELLRMLAGLEGGAAVQQVALHDMLPTGLDRDVWNRWIADFRATPEFVARATVYVEFFDQSERAANAAAAATRRLYDFSYPLSLIGMIGAVLGFGHLLSHRPPVGAKSLDTDTSPLTMRMVTYSLLLVVLYSALDLTWTILAYQAGQMQELNPLGSRLIEDPLRLIAFKVGATGLSVGLLFYLRRYCKAQLAAWWICLILTLLTARWLMMSSMFVA